MGNTNQKRITFEAKYKHQLSSSELHDISNISKSAFNHRNIHFKRDSIILCAYYGSRIIGIMGADMGRSDIPGEKDSSNIVLIYNFAVLPGYRNKKIGSEMLKRIFDYSTYKRMHTVELAVDANNFMAERLYKRFGFKKKYTYPDARRHVYRKRFSLE